MINSTPSYLPSLRLGEQSPEKWLEFDADQRGLSPSALLSGSITDWQLNLFVRNCAANERETPRRGDPPHVCLSHRLKDQQSLRSLICVFSLSGSLRRPDRSAIIKSGFSISIAACSTRSEAPG